MRHITRILHILARCLIPALLVYVLQLSYNQEMKQTSPLNETAYPITNYHWFMSMKAMFLNLGQTQEPRYKKGTPVCELDTSELGPIKVKRTRISHPRELFSFVKLGGYYAPLNCRFRHRVAILVPYRDRKENLAIFLQHMHPFLRKQNVEYRIFVIEQYGNNSVFRKGALFNIGFLESQRYGEWQCFIFHDLNLLPLDDRILYSCPRRPTHMSTAIEAFGFKLQKGFGYRLPRPQMFGGVVAMTMMQFESVNGYSNLYLGSAQDEDIYYRLQSKRYPTVRYNTTVARYASIAIEPSHINFLWITILRFKETLTKKKDEGLTTLKYRLIHGQKKPLFTCILADLSPLD